MQYRDNSRLIWTVTGKLAGNGGSDFLKTSYESTSLLDASVACAKQRISKETAAMRSC